MQQITSKRAEDTGVDRDLAEQYAEVLRLRLRVRQAEMAARKSALSDGRSEES
jgi:hypothetical protein